MNTKHKILAAACLATVLLSGCVPALVEPGYGYADPSYGNDVFVSTDVYRGSDGTWRDRQHQHEVRELTKEERSHWNEAHHAAPEAHGAPAHAPAEHAEHEDHHEDHR